MNKAPNNPMIPVAEALARVLEPLVTLPAEQVSLSDALGRVLADDLMARTSHPPTAVSAMDGYAVRAEDLAVIPVQLTCIGEAAAGNPTNLVITAQQCLRIFTGAPMPIGADSVLIQENTLVSGDQVTARETVKSGQFVRPKGLDFAEGDKLFDQGQKLSARDLGLIAAMNIPWVMVRRKPRIAVLSTGDEIQMPGDPLGPGQIVSSNSVAIAAYIQALGGEPVNLGIARDTQDSVMEKFQAARGVDLIVTSGGASVGDYDIVAQVMGSDVMELTFNKVAMRPGKPVISGRMMGIPLLGLPGNPVSSGVSSALYLKHAIDKMLGIPEPDRGPKMLTAKLGTALNENDKRQDYLRARLSHDADGTLIATPFSRQDSAMMANFARADALIIREPKAQAAGIGDSVTIMMLDTGHQHF